MYSVGTVDLNLKVCVIHHCSVNGQSYRSVQRYPRQRILCLIAKINPLNAELNPICHLQALLGGVTVVVVSRLRVKEQNKNVIMVIIFFQRFASQVPL